MKILIAEEQQKIRQALRLLIQEKFNVEVATCSNETEQLFDVLRELQPDIVLISSNFLDGEAEKMFAGIRKAASGIRIVALVGRKSEAAVAMESGAEAVIGKSETPDRLIEQLAAILARGAGGSRSSGLPRDHWKLTSRGLRTGEES